MAILHSLLGLPCLQHVSVRSDIFQLQSHKWPAATMLAGDGGRSHTGLVLPFWTHQEKQQSV